MPLEGYKRARKQVNETWNPDTPQLPGFVPKALGWNYSLEQRMELYKLQQSEEAQAFIESQARLPENLRVRPPDEFNWTNPFEALSAGEYWSGAKLAEAKSYLQTGKVEERSYREKIEPGTVLYGKEEEIQPERYQNQWQQIAYEQEEMHKKRQRFAANVAFDPLSWITGFAGGAKKIVLSGGKQIGLTPEGMRMYADLIKRYGGEVPEIRHIFSQMLRENPMLYSKAVQKEGIRIIGTNIELIPKQFLLWTYIGGALSTGKKVLGGGFDAISSVLNRQYSKTLSEARGIPSKYIELKTNYDINIELAKQNAKKEIDSIAQDAQKLLGRNAGTIITEYIENPDIRQFFPQVKPIFDRIETLHQQMAVIEKSQGLLTGERVNYIRHILTTQAKVLKGYLPSINKRIEVENPYNIQRQLQGTIRALNEDFSKKFGVNLFEPNAFNSVIQRYNEHIQSTQTIAFLNDIKRQFGASKAIMKNYVQSSIPQLKGVYIPEEIERALKNDYDVKQLLEAMGQKSKLDTAYQIAKMPFKAIETVNRFWQRSVTVYFPKFHVLNYIGGKWNNYLAGNYDFRNDNLIEDALRGKKVVIVSDTGIKYTEEDINRIMDEQGIRHQPGAMDVARGGYGTGEGLGAMGRRVGMAIEDRLRGTLLLDRLKKGDTPEEAAAYINKFHFDYYQQLGSIESALSKYFAFYMWLTRNTVLQAEMILKQPGKFAALAKLMSISESGPEAQVTEPYKPAWTQGKVMFYVGGNQSNYLSIPLPVESITTLPQMVSSPLNATQMLYPTWQIPLEEYLGEETFTGKNITNQWDYLLRKGAGRYITTIDKLRNPNTPGLEKMTELFLGNVYQANDWIAYSGVLKENSERVVNNAIRRLGGKAHGCGF